MTNPTPLAEEELEQIENLLNCSEENPDNLVKILQAVQAKLGYVPLEGQRLIAQRLRLPLSRVYGIVSFYNFFKLFPPGRHVIRVCLGTACYVRGAKLILEEIKKQYGIEPEETTPDRKFSLEVLRCLGCCAIAPVITIDGKVYGRNNPAKVRELLKQYT